MGGGHALIVTHDGALLAWGRNDRGQCGLHSSLPFVRVPRAVQRLAGAEVAEASCGTEHSAAVSAAGGLYTWGRGTEGQLGLGPKRQGLGVHKPRLAAGGGASDRYADPQALSDAKPAFLAEAAARPDLQGRDPDAIR